MDPREKAHEQVLVVRCQSGDQEAFASLFKRYCGPLKYYLRRLLDSPETADDVSQTVWLKVLRGIKKLRRVEAFRAWLYRIARNEAIQQLRRDRHGISMQENDLPAELNDEPEDMFTQRDAARVHAALVKLAPLHREAVTLRFLEDMSYEEIASVVGCELGTVRSRLHYAKRALRQLLEESDDDC